MPYEDFTTYTEQDDDGCITVQSASFVDVDDMPCDNDNLLYSDKGPGHFAGDFEHLVQAKSVADDSPFAEGGFWALCNVVEDYLGWGPPTYGLMVSFRGGDTLRIRERKSGANDTASIIQGTIYYPKLKRQGTTTTCYIYSDADRTMLVDSISVSEAEAQSYRYVYAAINFDNDIPERHCSYDVRDMDLQEAVGLPIPVAMRYYRNRRVA